MRRSNCNRFFVESLESRRLLAAITWDGGGDGTNWSSPNNWSTNALPGQNDDVTISLPAATNIVLSASASVKSLIVDRPFTQSGGTLSVTIDATFNNTFNWSGGSITGTFKISSSGVGNFTGATPKIILDALTNDGVINYTSTNLQLSTATLTNNGTFNADWSGDIAAIAVGGNFFNNTGTFSKTGTTNMKFSGVLVNNTGTFKPNTQGSVELQGGSTTKEIIVAAGGRLLFTSGTFTINMTGVAFSGFGEITLADSNGTAKLSLLTSTAIIENLNFTGGTLEAGPGHLLTLAQTFDWSAGVITHNVAIDADTIATFSGSGTKRITDTIISSGTVNYTGSNFEMLTATFNNFATFNAINSGNIVTAGGFTNAFNNSGAFTKSGASTMRFTDVPITGNGTFNITEGNVILEVGSTAKSMSGNGSLTISAGTTLTAPSITQGTVNVVGLLTLDGSNARTTFKNLTLTGNGSVDIGRNALVIDYDGVSPLTTLQPKLISGRNNGAWNGIGIRSSNAASDSSTSIGFGEATAIGSPAMYMNANLDQTSLIFRHTNIGDANLSHNVDFSDLLIVAQNYGLSGRSWTQGNFDFSVDGLVSFNDLLGLAQNYGESASRLSSIVQSSHRISDQILKTIAR
ncbi:MAG TPA: hypothetical protein PK402_03240 [Tepidisphaeraceae bacterium]|nr:hypothetical protein [Tepidisphaeraceae bacterium]